jgi:hypothetical protein
MNKTKKIRQGQYEYRGFVINNCGYYEPEHKTVWEGIDKEGNGIARGYTKKDVMYEIDFILNRI